jgi:hypothetical protein
MFVQAKVQMPATRSPRLPLPRAGLWLRLADLRTCVDVLCSRLLFTKSEENGHTAFKKP